MNEAQCFVERVSEFFFSSRRRHTRCSRDWSSDVCSSDLSVAMMAMTTRSSIRVKARRGAAENWDGLTEHSGKAARDRSEERRVGKECRSWWWPDYFKNKKM